MVKLTKKMLLGETTEKIKKYLIKGPVDSYDGEQLYWSNNLGWVDKSSATRFRKSDVSGNLPIEATGVEEIIEPGGFGTPSEYLNSKK